MAEHRDPRGLLASVDQLQAQVESLSTQLGFLGLAVLSLVAIVATLEIRRIASV
jgi:prefoldin subunit 5